MGGVDNLSFSVEPCSGSLGIRFQIVETERGRNGVVPSYPGVKGVLVGVDHEVPYWNAMLSEAVANFAPVLFTKTVMGITNVPPV